MNHEDKYYRLEAEQGVLGAIMIASLNESAGMLDEIISQMKSGDFWHQDNAALFDVICDCHAQRMPVDAVTLGSIQHYLPSGTSTLQYTIDLCRGVPSAANWKSYAQQVRKWALVRQFRDLGRIVDSGVYDDLPADEILDQCDLALADLRDLKASGKAGYKRMSDVLPIVLDHMDDVLNDKAPPKLSTGLADLDKLIGFLRQKSMVVIGGRPGGGKTMLGLQIMNHVATRGHGVGLVVSLEMPGEQLTLRTIASLGGVDLRRMDEVKCLEQEEWNRIGVAAGKIKEAELYLLDTPGLTMPAIRAEALKLQREVGLDILMIDYVQIVGTDGKSQNRADAVAKVSIAIMNLSRELAIPILVLAQLNRGPANRPGKKPQASDLKESGQIEQDADAVILVHYDRDSEMGQQGVTELILDKGRQAEAGSCLVQRQGQFGRFVNFAGREPTQEEVEISRPFSSQYKGKKNNEKF
ncbi:replicative DNA helicase [Pseudomonas synxantha]|jgi:replicative DNA helicase|uniref:DNA 5'-3' helicase n=1 Tax=Pseudomonas synxantha TaxID=47883 RepID=A0AAX3HZV0_9PSED|nr:DnaB-like helicase C-terminal domain-containing protein [Pseudomonas synxantha]KRP50254.1 helicase DnaB [Pseudomonas synxantha]MBJ2318086.1 AAA family ATPase [Pseudomonas fluorescens]SDU68986.1 replicative DNA helicase [Pseudomonas synxantha]VTQ88080.1 DnaB domain-containing protein [Pseudomonas synxantha]